MNDEHNNDMDIVLSACLVQPNIYTMLNRYLVPECFTSNEHKYIYELLVKHVDRYKSAPQIKDLISMIDNNEVSRRGLLYDSVRDTISDLMTQNQSIDDVIKDKAKKLILEYRMRIYLTNLVDSMKKGADKIYTESMKDQLIKLLEVDFATEDAQVINFQNYWDSRIRTLGKNGESVIKSFLPSLNDALVAKGFIGGSLNMVVGPPGAGKTTLLINEGKYAVLNGLDVLHVFIGDMTEYSVMTKYLSCICEIDMRTLVTMKESDVKELFECINEATGNALDRIHTLIYPSSAIRVEDLVTSIKRARTKNNVDYKVIIIDYPDNLLHGDSSMYTDGGIIYSHLEKLAKDTKSVVWVASQPKTEYWDTEVIPLRGASESSRKQHTVDTMITFNLHSRDANFGSIHLAKIRDGKTGGIIRVKTDYSRSIMSEISEDEYTQLLREYNTNRISTQKKDGD